MAREFSVIVGIDAGPARRGAREFKAGADQVTRSSQRMAGSMITATRGVTALSTQLSRLRGLATLAFSGFLGAGGVSAVVRTLSDFGTALSKVEALLGDRAVGGAMTALSEKARELGATTVFTATQAAQGMEFLTLAGFDALEVYEAIGPALSLAQAGALGLGEAADIVSNVMSGFRVEASRTVEVADALAFVASRSNTNIRQLGEAMKFVAPVAGAVGIRVEETAAALGILGNSGLQASLAGTSLRRVISGLLNPSKEATTVLTQMGLTSEELVSKLGDEGGLADVIRVLAERGISAADAFTLFGQRGAPGLLSLVNQVDKLDDLNVSLQDIQGTAESMAQVMTDNLGGDARLAVSALQEGIIQLGKAGLTQFLRDTTQRFAGFLRGLTDVRVNMLTASEAMKTGVEAGEKFRDNLDSIKTAATVLAAFLFRNMLFGFTQLIAQVVAGTAAFIGFNSGLLGTAAASNAAAVGLARMRTALVRTGVGALAVAVGFLADWVLTSGQAEESTDEVAFSMDNLADKVAVAAFNFDKLSQAEQELEFTRLTKLIGEQEQKLRDLGQAALDAEASQLLLPPAQERLAKATEALNKVYGEGFDIQTIYAAAGSENAKKLIEFRDAQQDVNEIVSQFGTNTLPEVRAALGKTERELTINIERQKVWRLLMQDSNLTLAEATARVRGLTDARKEAAAQLQRETGLTLQETNNLEELIKKYDKTAIAIAETESALKLVNKALENAQQQGSGNADTVARLQRVIAGLEDNLRDLRDTETAAQKATQKFTESLEDLRDSGDKLAMLKRQLARDTQDLIREWVAAGAPAGQLAEALRLLNEEFAKNSDELENACEKTDDLTGCMSESAKAMQTIWNQALRNIQDAFADAFKGAFDSFSEFRDRLIDAVKSMIAELLSAKLLGGLKDVLGGIFDVGGSGGGVGGIDLGKLKDIFSKGFEGLKEFGTKILSGLKAFGQGFIEFFRGSSGSGLAGTLGSVAGGAVTGLASGSITNQILGSRGDPGTTNTLSAVGGAVGGIFGGPIGALIGGALGSFASNLFGGAKKLEQATLLFEAAGDQLAGSVETVVSKQKSFFRGRSFTTTTEELDVGELQGVFSEVIDRLSNVADALGVDSSAFANFTFSREINIKGLTEEQIGQRLESVFNDALLGTINNFINSADGLSERLTKTVQVFRGNAEEFVRAFELASAIDMLLLVDPVKNVTDEIAEQNMTLTASYRELLEGYRGLIAEYDGSLDQLEALAVATELVVGAQTQLVAALMQAGTEISGLFQDSAQTIREALLTEEELFNLRKSQIDELVAQASTTTDPAELSRLAEEINRLGLDAFNLLDESQRGTLGAEFIDFFEGLDDLFGDQIQGGIDAVSEDSSALNQEVATAMTDAAQAQLDAANITRSTMDELRDWFRGQRIAGGGRLRELNP